MPCKANYADDPFPRTESSNSCTGFQGPVSTSVGAADQAAQPHGEVQMNPMAQESK